MEVTWVIKITKHLMFNAKCCLDLWPESGLDCSQNTKNKNSWDQSWPLSQWRRDSRCAIQSSLVEPGGWVGEYVEAGRRGSCLVNQAQCPQWMQRQLRILASCELRGHSNMRQRPAQRSAQGCGGENLDTETADHQFRASAVSDCPPLGERAGLHTVSGRIVTVQSLSHGQLFVTP